MSNYIFQHSASHIPLPTKPPKIVMLPYLVALLSSNSKHPKTSRNLSFLNPCMLSSFTHPFSYNSSEDTNLSMLGRSSNLENPETSRNLSFVSCTNPYMLYSFTHLFPTTPPKIPMFPYLASLLTQST